MAQKSDESEKTVLEKTTMRKRCRNSILFSPLHDFLLTSTDEIYYNFEGKIKTAKIRSFQSVESILQVVLGTH